MKIFVIGATGYLGSNIARHLAAHGHRVTGFARNQQGADKVRNAGHQAYVGDIADHQALCQEALAADATIFAPQLLQDEEHATVKALLASLKSSGKHFIFTSGTGVLGIQTNGHWVDDTFAETDSFEPRRAISLRVDTENLVRAAARDGVRAMVARPPMIWGNGTYPADAMIVESIQKTGAACYVGPGLNMYSNVHVDDLAELYRLMLEKGTAGNLYHCVSGELSNRCIAEFVARREGCETRSVTMDEAIEIWGKFAAVIVVGASSRSRSPLARSELGWAPTRVDLIDEILRGAFGG